MFECVLHIFDPASPLPPSTLQSAGVCGGPPFAASNPDVLQHPSDDNGMDLNLGWQEEVVMAEREAEAGRMRRSSVSRNGWV